jgi:hypothetical protein
MCTYIETDYLMPGFLCCHCIRHNICVKHNGQQYNGIQRQSCKRCNLQRCSPLLPDSVTGKTFEETIFGSEPYWMHEAPIGVLFGMGALLGAAVAGPIGGLIGGALGLAADFWRKK